MFFLNKVLFILQTSLHFLFTFVFFSPINVCISGTAFFLVPRSPPLVIFFNYCYLIGWQARFGKITFYIFDISENIFWLE